MIICSCNVISDKEIRAAVEELVGGDPNVVLTPGKVYRAMCCRPKCGTCLQHVVKLMHEHREEMQCACQADRPSKEKGRPRRRPAARAVRPSADLNMDKTPETV